MRRAPLVPVLVGLLTGACASDTSRTTWEQDAREGITSSLRTRTSSQTLSLAPERLTMDPSEVARRLEHRLLVFGARHRSQPDRHTPGWSEATRADWLDVLFEVERALTQPLGSLPRSLLIQVRVVLEAEMERATKTGQAPPDVDRRLARAFVGVARRLRAKPRRETPPVEKGETAFMWPVSPIILTSRFGYRRDPIYRDGRIAFHAGIDLAGRTGDPVQATRPGEVLVAGWKGGYGRAVFVQHTGGFVSVYGHLSRVLVETGTFVDKGQPIGLMGSTGRATGSHLHFEVRLGSTPLNPLDILNAIRPVEPLATVDGRSSESPISGP